MTDAGAAVAEWTALLEGFAHDLDAPAAESATWRPAAHPLPPQLAEAARELARRQEERMSLLRLGIAETTAHLAALQLVPAARGEGAAYVEHDA